MLLYMFNVFTLNSNFSTFSGLCVICTRSVTTMIIKLQEENQAYLKKDLSLVLFDSEKRPVKRQKELQPADKMRSAPQTLQREEGQRLYKKNWNSAKKPLTLLTYFLWLRGQHFLRLLLLIFPLPLSPSAITAQHTAIRDQQPIQL